MTIRSVYLGKGLRDRLVERAASGGPSMAETIRRAVESVATRRPLQPVDQLVQVKATVDDSMWRAAGQSAAEHGQGLSEMVRLEIEKQLR